MLTSASRFLAASPTPPLRCVPLHQKDCPWAPSRLKSSPVGKPHLRLQCTIPYIPRTKDLARRFPNSMCGIAGFVDGTVSIEVREAAVRRMCAAMVHRGPDDLGIESRGCATIGMRRLAIFDPSNGHQPMKTRDGRYSLVFNGAIYNFRELQSELESLGWTFSTHCDTEILLAALVNWGKPAIGRLRGMFAFALWDAEEESLLLARDPMGIKPLYFALEGQRLVFASEAGGLLASGAADNQIDPRSVAAYLSWLAVPAPQTIYRGIMSLEPGQMLTVRGGKAEFEVTWRFSSIPGDIKPCSSHQEFILGLRAQLEDSIRAHVLADVPVGAFLSGGLDSAVVAGLMSRVSSNALKTFSIGFDEDEFSEADYAEDSARFFGSVHHTRIVTGDEVARDMDKILAACDQPTGDGINTYYASETARQGGAKVALSGLGGDELFGGYPSFRAIPSLARFLPRWRVLPSPVRTAILGTLGMGGARARKLSDFLRHSKDSHDLASLQRRVFSDSSREAILSPDVAASIRGEAPFHPKHIALKADVGPIDDFSIVSAWEMRTYMADVLLRDSDVMSMRHSIELRVPFVDRPLVEWLWRQPASYKGAGRSPKSVLVEATRDILPPGMEARVKRGFTFPFPIWMRKDLRPFLEDTFSSDSLQKSGFFWAKPAQLLWNRFAESGDNREWSRVWSLAVLVSFVNRPHAPRTIA
jgi:asparagine synthase (glutamine-hydrolysing)